MPRPLFSTGGSATPERDGCGMAGADAHVTAVQDPGSTVDTRRNVSYRRSMHLMPPSWLFALAVLVPAAGRLGAEDASGAGTSTDRSDLQLAWTIGAHASIPLGPAVDAAVIIGHANRAGADGLLLMVEPGIAGGKIAIGYADIDGSAQGPYLVKQCHDYGHDHGFLWAMRGWSLRGVLVQGWGTDLGIPQGRVFGGIEGEIIGTIDADAPWGGLHGVNLTLGLLSNVDRVDNGPVRRPGDQWRLDLELGIGF